MKYWLLIAAVAVLAFAVIAISNVREKRSQQKRDVAYQTKLRLYSEVFQPGMTRKEVEDGLRAKNEVFRQMCCVNIKKTMDVWDDLVKIAQENPPWICSEKNVYIAFQFAGTRPSASLPSAEPGDKLTAVTLYPWLERCL